MSSMASAATEHTPLRGRSTCCGDTAFRVRLITVIASLAEGYDFGIVANSIGPMQVEFGLDPVMIGLVVSGQLLAAMIAALPAGSLIDSFGRKPVIAISAALIFAGNVCWALAPNIIVLIIGRIILGLGIGFGIGAITVYMAEVAPLNQRGFYVSMEMLFMEIGILCGYAAGALLVGVRHDWRILVGIGAVLPLVIFIFALTPLLPESPRFLQAVGRVEEAREILLDLLHGDEQEVDDAFAKWAATSSQKGMDWSSAMSAFVGSHSRQALAGIGTGAFVLLSGLGVVLNYSVLILAKNGMSNKTAAFALLLIGTVKTCTLVLPTFFLLERCGRRPLLLTTPIIMGCACVFIAFAVYADLGAIWIAIGLGIMGVGFAAGLGPVSFVYISEVFDNTLRAKGTSCSLFALRLSGVVVVGTYPALSASLGISAVFLILAGFNACALTFFWVFCPETRGVSLEDVNKIFQDQT